MRSFAKAGWLALLAAAWSCGQEGGASVVELRLHLAEPGGSCAAHYFEQMRSLQLSTVEATPKRGPCVSVPKVSTVSELENALRAAGTSLPPLTGDRVKVRLLGFDVAGCVPGELELCGVVELVLTSTTTDVTMPVYCEGVDGNPTPPEYPACQK